MAGHFPVSEGGQRSVHDPQFACDGWGRPQQRLQARASVLRYRLCLLRGKPVHDKRIMEHEMLWVL